MRAIQLKRFGGPDVLDVVEMPKPLPEAGEVLIRVRAAGVNFFEVLMRGDLRGHAGLACHSRRRGFRDRGGTWSRGRRLPDGDTRRGAAVRFEAPVWRLCRVCDDRRKAGRSSAGHTLIRRRDGVDGAGADGFSSAAAKPARRQIGAGHCSRGRCRLVACPARQTPGRQHRDRGRRQQGQARSCPVAWSRCRGRPQHVGLAHACAGSGRRRRRRCRLRHCRRHDDGGVAAVSRLAESWSLRRWADTRSALRNWKR